MDLSKIVFNQLFTLAVPESELSEEGIHALVEQIHYTYGLSPEAFRAKLPKDWSWLAKIEHGTYAGTISKRLQSYLFKEHAIKLGENDVAALGNLAAQHVLEAREFYFDFDQDLKWKAGEYGDKGSCFWTQKPHVLPILKHFGGFAIRLYDRDGEKRKGIGRALIMPLVKNAREDGWHPEQFREPQGLLVFNGYGSFGKNYGKSSVSSQTYGQMQVYDYARLLALFLGVSYERVILMVNDSYEYPLYVNNNGTAVLVGPTEVVTAYKAKGKVGNKEYQLLRPRWSEERIGDVIVLCDRCRTMLVLDGPEANGKRSPDGHKYCLNCYRRFYATCYADGQEYNRQNLHQFVAPALNLEDGALFLCHTCEPQHTFHCAVCRRTFHLSERLYYHTAHRTDPAQTPQRLPLCRQCYHTELYVSPCPVCTRDYAAHDLAQGNPLALGPCPQCRAKGLTVPKDAGEAWSYLSPQPSPPVEEAPADLEPLKAFLRVDANPLRANWNPIIAENDRERWRRLMREIQITTLMRCEQAARQLLGQMGQGNRPNRIVVDGLEVGQVTHDDTLEIFNHFLREMNMDAEAVDYRHFAQANERYRIDYQMHYPD